MKPVDFIHQLRWSQIPKQVQHQVKRCLLDTIGAAIGGRRTKLSVIIYDFVNTVYKGKGAHLWLDGREVSPVGAALAHGMTIDALDIHDNFNQAKGHAGVAVVPAVFAALGLNPDAKMPGRELLTTLVVGYEVALRAGITLHATVCDYHTSGAWNAMGCAAIVARWLGFNKEMTRHALGIAEYYGPRSQMMRCIDYPTMLKDGSGWGAMTGVSAGLLANKGFTGAPALTIESKEAAIFWEDMGKHWYLMDQNFKRYAVCHWAQPPIAGTLDLLYTHHISPQSIEHIEVLTFHEATRLKIRHPKTTEEAQYSLPYPVAAAIVYGHLGPNELSGEALTDPRVLRLADRIKIEEDEYCNTQFPNVQLARVRVKTSDGQSFESDYTEAPWDISEIQQPHQPSDQELGKKFRWLVSGIISKSRAAELEDKIRYCDEIPNAEALSNLLISS